MNTRPVICVGLILFATLCAATLIHYWRQTNPAQYIFIEGTKDSHTRTLYKGNTRTGEAFQITITYYPAEGTRPAREQIIYTNLQNGMSAVHDVAAYRAEYEAWRQRPAP
jgi:hypothetical protein